jgi:Tol biopolymer transport system component
VRRIAITLGAALVILVTLTLAGCGGHGGSPGASAVGAGQTVAGFPGARIAFARWGDGDGFDIWTMYSGGGAVQRITRTLGHDTNPVWSPYADRIAFSRQQRGPRPPFEAHIWTVSSRGGFARQLTRGHQYDTFPTWSPDGYSIAFTRQGGGAVTPRLSQAGSIWVMGWDGAGQAALTGGDDDWHPDWSPDGLTIIFIRDGQVWAMDRDGANPRALTSDTDCYYTRAHYSPSGSQLVVGGTPVGTTTGEVYTMDADGTNRQRLTNDTFDDLDPTWTPDSEGIVFTSFARRRHTGYTLYWMAADGTGIAPVSLHTWTDITADCTIARGGDNK